MVSDGQAACGLLMLEARGEGRRRDLNQLHVGRCVSNITVWKERYLKGEVRRNRHLCTSFCGKFLENLTVGLGI